MINCLIWFSIVGMCPVINFQRWLSQEILLGIENLVHILLKVFAEWWGYLVQAAHKCKTETDVSFASCWIFLCAWRWVENTLFYAVVLVKAINAASYSTLDAITCFGNKIKQVSSQFSRWWNWVERWKLEVFERFDVVIFLVHRLFNGRITNF